MKKRKSPKQKPALPPLEAVNEESVSSSSNSAAASSWLSTELPNTLSDQESVDRNSSVKNPRQDAMFIGDDYEETGVFNFGVKQENTLMQFNDYRTAHNLPFTNSNQDLTVRDLLPLPALQDRPDSP